jgi:hypothetical protein
MRGKPWAPQLAEGRVFELRSSSTTYPPPCALIVRNDERYGVRHVVEVDRLGVCSWPQTNRRGRHNMNIDGLRIEDLPKRITRRRRDLERFDRDDLALIRYGGAIDFDGYVTMHHYSDLGGIPSVALGNWTVFWIPAYDDGDFDWGPDGIEILLRGAWHMTGHGGARRLGYKYGHAWATRHTGRRLKEIRESFRRWRGNVIEQEARVVRWNEGDRIFTAEIHRESPALGRGMITNYSTKDHFTWFGELV